MRLTRTGSGPIADPDHREGDDGEADEEDDDDYEAGCTSNIVRHVVFPTCIMCLLVSMCDSHVDSNELWLSVAPFDFARCQRF